MDSFDHEMHDLKVELSIAHKQVFDLRLKIDRLERAAIVLGVILIVFAFIINPLMSGFIRTSAERSFLSRYDELWDAYTYNLSQLHEADPDEYLDYIALDYDPGF